MTMTDNQIETTTVVEIDWRTLSALATVSASASTDSARPVLLAIHLYTEGGRLVADATDSYTLGRLSVESDVTGLDALIPAKWLVSSLKSLKPAKVARVTSYSSSGKLVTLSVSSGMATLSDGSATFTTELISGTFPSVSQLIPEPSAYVFEKASFNLRILTRMNDILPSSSAKVSNTWTCVSMPAQKPSIWTRSEFVGADKVDGLLLVMPVRVN